jgi:hypothetical protein
MIHFASGHSRSGLLKRHTGGAGHAFCGVVIVSGAGSLLVS